MTHPALVAENIFTMSKITQRLLIVALAFLSWSLGLRGQPLPTEYEVKAAFLYNFIKYVEWPEKVFPSRETPLTIGILGEDPFGDLLDKAIEGKKSNGRKIVVRRHDQLQNLKDCHLIFISRSERGRLNALLGELRGATILTVSETERFAERGGIINFKMQGEKVRFEINIKAAESAGLKISSKLLSVATVISAEPH
jgi:hypothetical protein